MGPASPFFSHEGARELRHAGVEWVSEVATMMTDPAFAIKNTVQQLVDVQIDTLRKPSSLTHRNSMNIARDPREFSFFTDNWI
jgi:hypothetical protein